MRLHNVVYQVLIILEDHELSACKITKILPSNSMDVVGFGWVVRGWNGTLGGSGSRVSRSSIHDRND